jgi:TRAP-type uncharacterized transport system substrate-binding protein
MLRYIVALAAASLAFVSSPAALRAQTADDGCDLRIAGGPSGKVYALMIRDMQAACGSTVRICALPSAGGTQNLSLLAANEADLGIVQVDVLEAMRVDDNIAGLQAVMPLHNNLLHVLALVDGSLVGATVVGGVALPYTGEHKIVRRFSDLKGLKIAAVGTAQQMARSLEDQLGYGMTILAADTDEQAIALLRAGEAQAIFTLGGWPLPAISRIPASSGLALVDYDLTPQVPNLVVKRTYQNLGALNLKFLATPNVLVTRPFKPDGTIGSQVGALKTCLLQHLQDFQEGRYQAGWKEISDPAATFGIKPFPAKAGSSAAVVR